MGRGRFLGARPAEASAANLANPLPSTAKPPDSSPPKTKHPQALHGKEPQLQLNYGGGRSRGGAQLNQHRAKEGAPGRSRLGR
jgi:hypothetical protein